METSFTRLLSIAHPIMQAPIGNPILRYSAALPLASMTGGVEALAQYAGQAVDLVRDALPAARIIANTVREAEAQIAYASRLLRPEATSM